MALATSVSSCQVRVLLLDYHSYQSHITGELPNADESFTEVLGRLNASCNSQIHQSDMSRNGKRVEREAQR
ncbi:hypothetical protein FA13DRAFT_1729333 [Coprinellus micaceus]|uniref:Uncharacterized protein n=1 Tax=Coprinellus micaceus TaxID=71717 RepID=A0A4Y7TKH9_COPMI|nr:hypothetical protein FA13DRAFT_1729333 [Coprinellus micaceus]